MHMEEGRAQHSSWVSPHGLVLVGSKRGSEMSTAEIITNTGRNSAGSSDALTFNAPVKYRNNIEMDPQFYSCCLNHSPTTPLLESNSSGLRVHYSIKLVISINIFLMSEELAPSTLVHLSF